MVQHHRLPDALTYYLTESSHAGAPALLEAWIASQGLELTETTNVSFPNVPAFQLGVPTPAGLYPLLTLQPPPNHPDVPLHRMKAMTWGPLQAPESREQLLKNLNAEVAAGERKPGPYADRFFRIPWRYFASPGTFERITRVLDQVIAQVRAA
jgi:hypothetical protein